MTPSRLKVFGLSFILTTCAGASLMPAAAAGRYEMTPVPEGQVRLDTETGEMALCHRSGDDWSCTPMREEGVDGLQAEVDRLAKENQELKDKITAFEDAGAAGPKPDEPGFHLTIPEKDIERLKAFAQDLYRRFQDMVRDLQPPPEDRPA